MTQTTIVRATLESGMCFEVETGSGHRLHLDAAAESGGPGKGPRPMEMLPLALATCMGMTVLSILRKQRLQITAYEIAVRAERAEQHPRIFTAFELDHRISGHHIQPQALQRAIDLAETRYCGVSAMLRPLARISHRLSLSEASTSPSGEGSP